MTHRTERIEDGISREYHSNGAQYLSIRGYKQRKMLRFEGELTEAMVDEARQIRDAMPQPKWRIADKKRKTPEPNNAWNALSDVRRYQPKVTSQVQLWGGR